MYYILALIASYGILDSERIKVLTMMKHIGTHTRYYPKRYIKVSRFVRKFLRIEYKELPFFLYHELIMSIVWAIIFAMSLPLYAVFENIIVLYLILLFPVLYILEIVYVFTCYGIFKRKDGKKVAVKKK